MGNKRKEKSLIKELLLALVPYTRQNTLLVFKPNQFFNELERNSGYSKDRLRKTYYRAKQDKIITMDKDRPTLSFKGRQIVQPFIANKLSNDAQLMVIFDIPEEYAGRRQRLRNLLKQLDFKQVQLSVWMSDKDHREIIFESIVEYELQQWAQVYEASKIVT